MLTISCSCSMFIRKQADADALKVHRNMIPVLVDISDEAQCLAAARTVETELQKQKLNLLGLVNNAAYSQPAVLELVQLKDFKRQFESTPFFLSSWAPLGSSVNHALSFPFFLSCSECVWYTLHHSGLPPLASQVHDPRLHQANLLHQQRGGIDGNPRHRQLRVLKARP